MSFTTNIAFAGLTAAGKTTHAKRLAAQLGYDYVSATDILLEIVGIDDPSDQVWFTRLEEIEAAREGDAVDAELEARLIELARTRQRTVFDTWALAWIGDSPMVRIWVESDLPSRVRKCLVSQQATHLGPDECQALVEEKDQSSRAVFQRRHSFDLFQDRQRYDAILCNSHLIPEATTAAAEAGIEQFAPVVFAATVAMMNGDAPSFDALRERYPREVRRIATPRDFSLHA
ncbi:cytidylate kinase family protein [Actinosynnema sp. NPDC051121]